MKMNNGIYKTQAGSTVVISGTHSGISKVEFDWFEEGGCSDCHPYAYPYDGYLYWICEYCGGGQAELTLIEPDKSLPSTKSTSEPKALSPTLGRKISPSNHCTSALPRVS